MLLQYYARHYVITVSCHCQAFMAFDIFHLFSLVMAALYIICRCICVTLVVLFLWSLLGQTERTGYRDGSPTAVQAWQPCPLWEPSPSHPILLWGFAVFRIHVCLLYV